MTDATFSARFYASIRDYLGHIEEMIKEGDLLAAQKLGHKMLGLCQMFGTPEQVVLCEALENAESLPYLQQTLTQFYALLDNN
ncbi:Hpt domain-containing protein [Yersinia enterocolitica]|uniref:Hpt domain-containing protein n=1 Tax=Yersinia enterocolitica TaxID=630 RepID=UPI001C8E3ABB|nr:Hpt domain-containing protein [Yersinia enterocolitica]MBX9498051.1 Hpt domain-containing protein [Yersinia enterocolitica]HDL7825956.1 Hpt domain-containing protein [Yersinia enterocolitica]HDL7833884.1 Hpt domain-containing protein [Yersinia enterocolitica]HDL7874120.1 Hpt domain-containing protein [Yersinia enterocolitica]HDL7887309.1 Hpt domain-containing protein [Yersinia enterocolitica]